MKKQDEGFTLIELLIVIVILGILATVVVFAVAGIRDSGDQSACEAELRTVQTAIEAYYAEEGEYPAAVGSLDEYLRTDLQYWGYQVVSSEGFPAVSDAITNATIAGGNGDFACTP